MVQLALLRRRRLRRGATDAAALGQPPSLSARWLDEMLPFVPTADQRRAFAEIDGDLERTTPMQRLLMGEVGSGKTVVALYALLRAVEHGLQGALMAPTEPLAEQHFATIQALMAGEAIPIGLLTGSTPARRRSDLLGKLESGELSLIVGTHALIEEPVRFRSLAVAVIDEQHRFGVRQRAALDAKAGAGRGPHMLHMTATPIPRTLALSHYGDLDFTVLAELPRGRQPIQTHVCSTERERERAYDRMRSELRDGPPGVRRLSVGGRVRAAGGPGGDGRVRAAAHRRAARLPGVADARPAALGRQARGDGAVRGRRGRRARRHDRDRGRDRRPQRDRDAGRGRRALRDLTAAPAARPDRPRRARVPVPAVRAEGVAAAEGAGRAFGRVRAGRDRPRAPRRGRADRRAAERAGAVPRRRASA